MNATDVRITVVDAGGFGDDDLASANVLFNALEREVWPEDPVTPLAQALAEHHAEPARVRRTSVRAWGEDGDLIGAVTLRIDPEQDDDPEILNCFVHVREDRRRTGIGKQLLAHVVAFAAAEGRTRIVGRSFERVPAGELFASSVGAAAVSRAHTNHLLLERADRSMLEEWVVAGPRRAAGYELVAWDGPIPEDHLCQFVDLLLVMNDAPRDDLAVNDFTLTPERWREIEDQSRQQGHYRWTLVARRVADGKLVGITDLTWVDSIPGVGFIGSTGVREEHRGHALGKWLKAAMTLRALDERPDATEIRTDNADSNAAMLGINRELGYQPMLGSITWQADVAVVADALAEHSARCSRVRP